MQNKLAVYLRSHLTIPPNALPTVAVQVPNNTRILIRGLVLISGIVDVDGHMVGVFVFL